MDQQNEEGKFCYKSNVLYEWKCISCNSKYIGETSKNFYTRSLEHLEKSDQKAVDSFINNHQIEAHNGEQPSFSVKVLKSFKDPLSRQVYEGVHIRNCNEDSLNTKLDYYQTSKRSSAGVIAMSFKKSNFYFPLILASANQPILSSV